MQIPEIKITSFSTNSPIKIGTNYDERKYNISLQNSSTKAKYRKKHASCSVFQTFSDRKPDDHDTNQENSKKDHNFFHRTGSFSRTPLLNILKTQPTTRNDIKEEMKAD